MGRGGECNFFHNVPPHFSKQSVLEREDVKWWPADLRNAKGTILGQGWFCITTETIFMICSEKLGFFCLMC